MAYDLYVLNQRLPRFPLRDGYSDPQAMQQAVGKVFSGWLNEALIGNLQRRKACSQIFGFAIWMEQKSVVLEILEPHHFEAYLSEQKSLELCRFGEFIRVAKIRLPQLQWETPPEAC